MSKRNVTLLIIVLVIIIIAFFGFLYFKKSTNPVTSSSTGTNFFSQFNPFASVKPTPTQTTPVNVSGYVPPTPAADIILKEVSSMPIAGFIVFSKERLVVPPTPAAAQGTTTSTTTSSAPSTSTTTTSTTTINKPKTATKTTKAPTPLTEFAPAVRYVARATGYVYETFADTILETQFSNTIIPKIYDAFFGNSGQSVVMRYLNDDGKTIETFFGTLPKEYLGTTVTGTAQITGSFLPENVKSLALSPDDNSIFYLFDSGESMVGTTLNFLTNKKVQIFTSPFTEWAANWGTAKTITFTTKPAASVPGYAYAMDTSGKSFNEVLGNIDGLTTLPSPDGKSILYTDNSLVLGVYNIATNTTTGLGVKTLPEKCVWGKASDVIYCAVPRSIDTTLSYPDAWYQGEVSFSDEFWKIDVKTGNATLLVDPLTIVTAQDIDGIKLALSPDQNYLFFVNKKDSYLWELELNKTSS